MEHRRTLETLSSKNFLRKWKSGTWRRVKTRNSWNNSSTSPARCLQNKEGAKCQQHDLVTLKCFPRKTWTTLPFTHMHSFLDDGIFQVPPPPLSTLHCVLRPHLCTLLYLVHYAPFLARLLPLIRPPARFPPSFTSPCTPPFASLVFPPLYLPEVKQKNTAMFWTMNEHTWCNSKDILRVVWVPSNDELGCHPTTEYKQHSCQSFWVRIVRYVPFVATDRPKQKIRLKNTLRTNLIEPVLKRLGNPDSA